MRHRTGVLLALGLGLTLLTGCGAPAGTQDAVRAAAGAFTTAVTSDQYTTACTQLTATARTELESDAEQSCPQALQGAELTPGGEVSRMDVYGQQARVVLGRDTLFLARTPDGWKVNAAGCHLESEGRYACTVKGR
jgi:hypothetical protein